MSQVKLSILLTDTNAAYKLYFFRRRSILPEKLIDIPNLGRIEFHPIVLDEVLGHIGFWKKANEYGISNPSLNAPAFFKMLLDDDFPKLEAFIKSNMCGSIGIVDLRTAEFAQKRKFYDTERMRLQKKWQDGNVKGRKTTSKPSDKDYAILFSAEKYKLRIITHDEILAAVAMELLEEDAVLKVEDIIQQVYLSNKNLRLEIDKVLENLEYLSEALIKNRIYGDHAAR